MSFITEEQAADPRYIIQTIQDNGVRLVLAKFLDYLLILVMPIIVVLFWFTSAPQNVIAFLLFFIISWVSYHVLTSALRGASIGFRIWGIRYVDTRSCRLVEGDRYFAFLEAKVYYLLKYGTKANYYELSSNPDVHAKNYHSTIVVLNKEYKRFADEFFELGRLKVKQS